MESSVKQQFDQLYFLISAQVKRLNLSGVKVKRKATIIRTAIISLTFLVTVILGIGIEPYGDKVALTLSALIAAITTWDSYAQYQRRLIIYVELQANFENLISDMTIYLSGSRNLEQDRFNEYKRRFSDIVSKFHDGIIGIETSSIESKMTNNKTAP